MRNLFFSVNLSLIFTLSLRLEQCLPKVLKSGKFLTMWHFFTMNEISPVIEKQSMNKIALK